LPGVRLLRIGLPGARHQTGARHLRPIVTSFGRALESFDGEAASPVAKKASAYFWNVPLGFHSPITRKRMLRIGGPPTHRLARPLSWIS
jgi:hypothetical protein